MGKWFVSVDSRGKESNGLAAARQYEQALVDGDGLRFCKIDAFRPDDGYAM